MARWKSDGASICPLAPIGKLAETNDWSWSLHERLLHGHLPDGGEVYVSFNVQTGALLFVEIPTEGAIREGVVTTAGKQRIEFTVADKWRRIVVMPAEGKPDIWTERKEKDEWRRQ